MHVEPPLIPLIESKNGEKSGKYCVEIKFCQDMTSQKLEFYEFRMALFDNDDLEEFQLFIRNFSMNLQASGIFAASANIQYLCTLVSGEVLYQFDRLSVEVGSTTS